jgi:Flp pilus assembly protein TadD
MAEGIRASAAGDTLAALAAFARALGLSPGDALGRFLLGSELAAAGKMEQAEVELLTAVAIAPQLQIARYQVGLLQFSSGRAALALAVWAQLLKDSPDSSLACFVRGFEAVAAGDFPAARGEFHKGLAVPPDNPAVAQDIRRVLERIPGAADAAHAPSPEHGSHVLLSNYGRHGPLH